MEKKNKPIVAWANSFEIKPIIDDDSKFKYNFRTKEKARIILDKISKKYITSRKDENEDYPDDAIKLWIKWFDVSQEEREKGYKGNYAWIRIQEVNRNQYTLKIEKVHVPLNFHPQKRIQRKANPNNGHPLLRRIDKGELFNNKEDALLILKDLHNQYPQTSLIATEDDKLYIQVYSKDYTPKPFKRFILRVVENEMGTFRINRTENIHQTRMERPNYLIHNISLF